jgi:hypothetical protein
VLTIVLPLVASRENSELQDLVTVSDNARIVSNIAVGLVVNLVVIYWLAISTEDFT